MRYIVAYDIANPASNRAADKLLRELGAGRILRALWTIQGRNLTAAQLQACVAHHLDRGDRLLVLPIPANEADFAQIGVEWGRFLDP